jgi:hypothetical protein
MVRGGEVVRDLKEKICLAHSIPVLQQRLVFKQQELPDNSTFESLQIHSGATLHLVLVASELLTPTPGPCYTCPGLNPMLSIHHFSIGLSAEQLACFADTPSCKQTTPLHQHTSPVQSPPHRISLPSHITHLVHAHDTLWNGFWMFLRYIYARNLGKHESKPDALLGPLAWQIPLSPMHDGM